MNDKHETAHEKELHRLFIQMRREDAAQAPDFPDATVLAEHEPVVVGRMGYRVMPKLAAAAAVAAIAILVLREPTPQDPAVLYADVMNANSIATDALLSVSLGALPGMASLPEVYEMEDSGDARQNIN